MWDRLEALRRARAGRRIAALFEEDPGRAARFTIRAGGMLLDYSKTQVDDALRAALIELAEEADLAGRARAMMSGAKINETEGRAALHTALRAPEGAGPVRVDGADVLPGVHATLRRMEAFAGAVREGRERGQGGAYTDIVNIGIGGSDLGPAMAVRALHPYADGPRCHFVSNVDGADIADTLAGLDPARTLVIVASKTFTTIETMTNAHTARDWMGRAVADPAAQFAALSTALDRTAAFGIPEARVFPFADWVGGRYSVWGPIGLALMIAIGPARFRDFLAGGHWMDRHFIEAPPQENMPLMLALTGLWHAQVCGHATRAVLPYDQRLARLPAYLQQLEMESNGKGVTMDGATPRASTAPVIWGEPGTNAQHSFMQLLHQGTQVVPCEFLVAAEGHEPELAHHHRLLVANCLAQAEALMRGRSLEEAREMLDGRYAGEALERQARHRVFPGDRPSVTLAYPKLTPEMLGRILALYEHRVFAEGAILGINSFDQWGVELGKELAKSLEPALRGEEVAASGSTRALAAFLRGA
ncbi:glucose-6-phosphate isomerase [Rhodosalinus halophilus]|uniref:Glucose-6-phosphate isomerase n=1 Tax=Rhodosalinus halophilus TaxID=2259333 RepID=A0A365U4V8_9RHOB|nr:glucose-6-phosphate isomerase [Rhodosalinus halophilus]RBI82867.1 glucose-6-phosphate isomerase [Rhodosalinus halophilus]